MVFVFSSQVLLTFGAPKVLTVCFLINSLLKLRANIVIFIVLFKGPSLLSFCLLPLIKPHAVSDEEQPMVSVSGMTF